MGTHRSQYNVIIHYQLEPQTVLLLRFERLLDLNTETMFLLDYLLLVSMRVRQFALIDYQAVEISGS